MILAVLRGRFPFHSSSRLSSPLPTPVDLTRRWIDPRINRSPANKGAGHQSRRLQLPQRLLLLPPQRDHVPHSGPRRGALQGRRHQRVPLVLGERETKGDTKGEEGIDLGETEDTIFSSIARVCVCYSRWARQVYIAGKWCFKGEELEPIRSESQGESRYSGLGETTPSDLLVWRLNTLCQSKWCPSFVRPA